MANMSKYYGGRELNQQQLTGLKSGKGVYVENCKANARDKSHGEIIYYDSSKPSVKTAKGYEYIPYSSAAVYDNNGNYSNGETFDMQDGYIQKVTQSMSHSYMYTDVTKTKTPVFENQTEADKKAIDKAGKKAIGLTDREVIERCEAREHVNVYVIQGKSAEGDKMAKNGRNQISAAFQYDKAEDSYKYSTSCDEFEELLCASRSEIIQPYPDYLKSKIDNCVKNNDKQTGLEATDKLEKRMRDTAYYAGRLSNPYKSQEEADKYKSENISDYISGLKKQFDEKPAVSEKPEPKKCNVDMGFTHGEAYRHDYVKPDHAGPKIEDFLSKRTRYSKADDMQTASKQEEYVQLSFF